ncbi:DUF4280 domain-containing protein [Orenia metallireducens]|uniref:DUF4280 domain-containing protein n=1 Tax=Orenia metallireducens TaxID=1413210 RepID=UPI001C3FFFD6|nr:DUF4280 domain-containing protein [Orenia metallireducens]
MEIVYGFKKDKNNDYKEDSKQREGKAKIKLGDTLIGKGIKAKENSKNEYIDIYGNEYEKLSNDELMIIINSEEDLKGSQLPIENFQEGDFGLWLEEPAPYYLEGDKIVTKDGKKASKEDVLALEENKFLDEDNRIQNEFLWIYAGEKIKFPEEVKEEQTQEEESQKDKQDQSTTRTVAGGTSSSSQSKSENQESNKQESKESSSPTSLGASGSKLYVCAGAKLECSQGDKEGSLKVVAGHNIKMQGNLVATMMDYKPMANIQPFGKCKSMANPTVAAATAANKGKLKPMPCVPNIVAPWTGGKTDVKVAGNPALLESSKLTCAYAGMIKITDPGQGLVKG